MTGTRWIKSADGSTAVNLDHVVSLAVERESDRSDRNARTTYQVVAITVLGSAISVASGLASVKQARGWIDDYVTTLAMTSSAGWVEGQAG
jgi:hypothetical protein